MAKSEKVPGAMQARYDEIVSLIDQVCHEHLNQEYAEMSRAMAATLARNRLSPLASGKAKSWACGIVYAIGRVNFLFDASQTPHVRADELCALFGVSASTGSAKSTLIFKLMDLMQFDPRWTLPSMMDENPMAWFIMVNGLIVDARHVPRPIQEEALRKGLIPYIPGEKPAQS